MGNDNIDKLFREKVNQLMGPPEDTAWNEEKGWILYQKQIQRLVRRKTIVLMSIAASLFIVLMIWIFHPYSNKGSVLVQNQTTEVKELTLPDGNKLWLNKNSSVEYPSKRNTNNFEIAIKGEVYIEINKLSFKRYTLKVYNVMVTAEKVTSFNIKAYPDKENIDITVAKGTIMVLEEGHPKRLAILITQGNYCSVHKSQKLIYASSNINNNYIAWKTGKLVFKDQYMATVTDILAEYYNTSIELSDHSLAYCMFSGSFEKPTIDKVMNKIQTDLNLKINYSGNKIIISGKRCL